MITHAPYPRQTGRAARTERTSPAACATRASSTTRAIAAQAHCARARLQSSGSPLRRGAKTVGQSAFLSTSEAGVSAALRGTGSWYGGERSRSGGSSGTVGDVLVRRRVECVPVEDLRTRLRCERVGVSRPEDLSHLFR